MKDIIVRSDRITDQVLAIFYIDSSVSTPKDTKDYFYTRIYRQTQQQYEQLLFIYPHATRAK